MEQFALFVAAFGPLGLFLIVLAYRADWQKGEWRTQSLSRYQAQFLLDIGLVLLCAFSVCLWVFMDIPQLLVLIAPIVGGFMIVSANIRNLKESEETYPMYVAREERRQTRLLEASRLEHQAALEKAEASLRRRGGATHEQEEDPDAMRRLSLD